MKNNPNLFILTGVLIYLGLSMLAILLLWNAKFAPKKKAPKPVTKVESLLPGPRTHSQLRLTFVGDLMVHEEQLAKARRAPGKFEFRPSFRYVEPYLREADLAFGNLETTFAGRVGWRRYSGHPTFNTPASFGRALKQSGFDVLFLANNHALDHGEFGLTRSLGILDTLKLSYAGVEHLLRVEQPLLILERQGIRLAVLAYTQHSNGSLDGREQYSLCKLDTARIARDLERARALGAELAVVHFHFGIEYERQPSPYQRKVVQHAIRHGADLIVGDHPHTLQPIETFASLNPRLDKGVVAYSLGNFLSHQFDRYTNAGLILNIEIEKDLKSGQLSLKRLQGTPTYVSIPHGQPHTIFPAEMSIKGFSTAGLSLDDLQRSRMRQAYEDTRKLLEKGGVELR